MSAKLFQCQFLGYGWTNQPIYYMLFCGKKIPNEDLSWSKSEKVYTRLYLNKLESIMRALSDALPTGHRAMAIPTLQLHFGCGRATPPVSHSHNWPSGRMHNFLFKIGQKSYFFANKDPKTNFDAWMILQRPVYQCQGCPETQADMFRNIFYVFKTGPTIKNISGFYLIADGFVHSLDANFPGILDHGITTFVHYSTSDICWHLLTVREYFHINLLH